MNPGRGTDRRLKSHYPGRRQLSWPVAVPGTVSGLALALALCGTMKRPR